MSECRCREFYCSTAKLPYALLGTLHHLPTFSAILLDVACFNMIHHNHHNHHRLVFHADRIPIKKKRKTKRKEQKSSNISRDETDYLMYEFLFFIRCFTTKLLLSTFSTFHRASVVSFKTNPRLLLYVLSVPLTIQSISKRFYVEERVESTELTFSRVILRCRENEIRKFINYQLNASKLYSRENEAGSILIEHFSLVSAPNDTTCFHRSFIRIYR